MTYHCLSKKQSSHSWSMVQSWWPWGHGIMSCLLAMLGVLRLIIELARNRRVWAKARLW